MSFHPPYRPSITPFPRTDHEIVVTEILFAWKGEGIVLLGAHDDDAWILSRGWQSDDQLTDIRRWVFADSVRFVAQVRRLVLDATATSPQAIEAADAAAGWVHLRRRDIADAG